MRYIPFSQWLKAQGYIDAQFSYPRYMVQMEQSIFGGLNLEVINSVTQLRKYFAEMQTKVTFTKRPKNERKNWNSGFTKYIDFKIDTRK